MGCGADAELTGAGVNEIAGGPRTSEAMLGAAALHLHDVAPSPTRCFRSGAGSQRYSEGVPIYGSANLQRGWAGMKTPEPVRRSGIGDLYGSRKFRLRRRNTS
jgi:hypothetical protein